MARAHAFVGAFLSVCATLSVVAGQEEATRRLGRVAAPVGPSGQTQELYAVSYALLIGVGRYDHPAAWAPLDSVGSELTELKTTLLSVGFNDVQQVINPTGDELRQAVNQFIGRHGYNPAARLVFYFSGHGFTLDQGRRGYFVPRDAPDPLKDEQRFRHVALSMDQVATWARDLTARHALFAFDSCFSGTIFRTRERALPEPISELTSKKVRLFLSAGGPGEPVPARSVFAPSFARGLRGAADLNGDGFVTGTELGNWVQAQVIGYKTRQTPQFGKLRDPDFDEGDIVFAVPGPNITASALPPALAALQQQCDSGNARACNDLGAAFHTGAGVPIDAVRAAALLLRACDGGQLRGCTNLGLMAERGQGIPKDMTRAVALHQRACEGDDAFGCNNLATLYLDGNGVAIDVLRAVALFQRSCEGQDDDGCHNLAYEFEHGRTVARDLSRALSFYRAGCELKKQASCDAVKRLAAASPGAMAPSLPPPLAEALKNCNSGVAAECAQLGYAFVDGHGIPVDAVRGAAFIQRACDGGDLRGCTTLGMLVASGNGVTKDASRAVALHQRACDGGDAFGCVNMGVHYLNGDGIAADIPRAVTLIGRSCTGGDADPCYMLATELERGVRVSKDLSRALMLYQAVCDQKHQPSCAAVKRLENRSPN